jgi:hypothetical protein
VSLQRRAVIVDAVQHHGGYRQRSGNTLRSGRIKPVGGIE